MVIIRLSLQEMNVSLRNVLESDGNTALCICVFSFTVFVRSNNGEANVHVGSNCSARTKILDPKSFNGCRVKTWFQD